MGSSTKTKHPHLRATQNGVNLIVKDRPFIILGGEVHNSTASSLEYLKPCWEKFTALNMNTVLLPVYWEQIEPVEGRFDFSLVEALIERARAHSMHVVFLWFGTIKNYMSSYVPEWVKTDLARFPRVQDSGGRSISAVSVFHPQILQADRSAFAALMHRIREIDEDHSTVVMVQVENEVGVRHMLRDFCPAAQEKYRGQVPEALMQALSSGKDSLVPEFDAIWRHSGYRTSGSWFEVFGPGAPEVFMAWHMSRFVDAVAAGGKKEYALPLFANAFIPQPDCETPGEYPSGGPVHSMFPVWKAGAPHIDLLAPDLYPENFVENCRLYTRMGNPLCIPETMRYASGGVKALHAAANHNLLCFSPFAIEEIELPHPLSEAYAILEELMPEIALHGGSEAMFGFFEQTSGAGAEHVLGSVRIAVRRHVSRRVPADSGPCGGLVWMTGPDEFLVAGSCMATEFYSNDPARPELEFLWCEEGSYRQGTWVPGRRLNGDETGHGRWINSGSRIGVYRVKVHRYPDGV